MSQFRLENHPTGGKALYRENDPVWVAFINRSPVDGFWRITYRSGQYGRSAYRELDVARRVAEMRVNTEIRDQILALGETVRSEIREGDDGRDHPIIEELRHLHAEMTDELDRLSIAIERFGNSSEPKSMWEGVCESDYRYVLGLMDDLTGNGGLFLQRLASLRTSLEGHGSTLPSLDSLLGREPTPSSS